MRRFLLSWSSDQKKEAASDGDSDRAASESDYVSLADLPIQPGSSRSLSLVFHNDGDDCHDGLVPLGTSDACRVHRFQDALLVLIAALCVLLACWACTQVYSGRLCVPATSLSTHNATSTRHCIFLRESHPFLIRGGPDLLLRDGRVFDGGWPISQTLLHVFSCAALLVCVAAMRLQSPTVHHSLAWVWFCFLLLSILLLDALRLWRWRGPMCALLQNAVASLVLKTTTDAGVDTRGQCVTLAYERFVTVEMVLVLALVVLVVLEPVLFRVWCGNGLGHEEIDRSTTKEATEKEGATALPQADETTYHKR